MTASLTVESTVHFHRLGRGARKELRPGEAPAVDAPAPRVPRVSKLMALAHRFERLVRAGQVQDYATLGRLGHVTRARISQIMNLLSLAPDIQEAILHLPPTERGRDPIHLAMLQPIAAVLDWAKQRRMWRQLTARKNSTSPVS